jgi:hypothetical protein
MATVQRYVNTASSAGGDGTTNGTAGSTRAYASLSEWEANAGGSATDDYVVDCCGTAADTTPVNIDFATDLTTGTVTVRGNRSDSAGFYTGNAVISTAHYRLTNSSGATMTFSEKNITLDGFQIEVATGRHSGKPFQSVRRADSIHHQEHATSRHLAPRIAALASGGSALIDDVAHTIENNLIVGFNLSGIEIIPGGFRTPTYTIRHNTIYGDGSAVAITITENASSAGTYTIKGNACANSR